MDQNWLIIVIVIVLILGIVFDGVRRMRKARFDLLQMKLKPTKKKNADAVKSTDMSGKGYGIEFPNGGARVSNRTIDPGRIKQVRNKYNFGSDMSAWRERMVEKIAGQQGKLQSHVDELRSEARIEPYVEVDPLMDNTQVHRPHATDVSEHPTQYIDSDYYDVSDEDNYGNNDDYQDDSFDYDLYDKDDATPSSRPMDTQTSIDVSKIAVNNVGNTTTANTTTANTTTASTTPVNTAAAGVPSNEYLVTPPQVSLNLDYSVPMLMDTFDEKSSDTTLANDDFNAHGPVKNSMNPFTRQVSPRPISTLHTPHNDGTKQTLTGVSRSRDCTKDKASPSRLPMHEEILVIHVRASQNNFFYGDELLELILEHGLRFGAMDIFHRHASLDGDGPILFSLSNMVNPGVFDLHTFEEFRTVGVSLFLALPVETDSYLAVFEIMLTTARAVAKELQGELRDENRCVLTGQTVEHYRERIRDFSRRQRLKKRKL